MRSHIRLGRLFGIEIGLHYSWLIIALLLTLSLTAHFQATHPSWDRGLIWTLAGVTAVLFFASIVTHELAHAAVARTRGLPVRSITLFALGGVARIEKEATDPKSEFWIGVIGPIASAIIGICCLGLALGFGWRGSLSAETPLLAMLVWLGYINIMLAVFNMTPGFPLDGGRVLRAFIWWMTGDGNRSTRIAARIGQAVGIGFIVLGVVRYFGNAGLGGLWIAFIGWFLLEAARESYAQVAIAESLRGVRAGDIMSRDYPTVDGRYNLQTFTDDFLLRTGRRCFVVVEDGRILGLITPQEVTAVERAQWPYTTVYDAMRPIERLRTITPETPLAEALATVGRDDVNQLPVVSNGRLEGIISRAHILSFLQTRADLKV